MKDNIIRIQEMEQYLNEVLNVLNTYPNLINEDISIGEKIEKLIEYYDSGQWLEDYEYDERGELPKDLKRGVLAQDTLYNLLDEIRNRKKYYSNDKDLY